MKEKNKSKKNKNDSKQKNDKMKDCNNGWMLFSDFYEITHIVIKESCVTIYRQDNKTMVMCSFCAGFNQTNSHKADDQAALFK